MLTGVVLKSSLLVIVANEVRGTIMAVPVLYGMYLAGGTLMALWIGFCSIAGIALSVAVPMFLGRKLKMLGAARSSGGRAILS